MKLNVWIFETLKTGNQENKNTKNQETKKLKSQETKKPRNFETKKPRNQETKKFLTPQHTDSHPCSRLVALKSRFGKAARAVNLSTLQVCFWKNENFDFPKKNYFPK